MMAFKLFFVIAFVAYARAGGPAAYSIAALSGDHAYVGSSHEHTVKGLYGQNVLSQYAKAVDSAHSSVRVSSSRQSNDILGGYAGYHGYGAPVVGGYGVSKVVSPIASPAVYGGYGIGYNKVVAPVAPVASVASVAPVVSHGYASPVISHGYATPYAGYGVSKVVAPYGASSLYGGYAHGLGYASKVVAPVSSVISHGVSAPYGAYHGYAAHHGYATPAYGVSKVVAPLAAPAVYGGYSHGYGVSKVVSPVSYAHGYSAPAIGYAPKVVAPVSSVVSHGYAAPAYGYAKAVSPYGLAAPSIYGGYGHGLGYGVSKVVTPYHSVAAPVYGGYGVSKVVSPVAAYGAVAPVAAVKTIASPAFTTSVVSHGASYSW